MEWHRRVGQANRYRRRILTIEAGVDVVKVVGVMSSEPGVEGFCA